MAGLVAGGREAGFGDLNSGTEFKPGWLGLMYTHTVYKITM